MTMILSRVMPLFIIFIVIVPAYEFLLLNEAFAMSPSFIRQEIKDGSDDWYFPDITHFGKNKRQVSDGTVLNLTGHIIGNIESVSYVSDGKTLNATYWLTAPFNKKPPDNHIPFYYMYIDVDSNKQTGWSGIDYIRSLSWDDNTQRWKTILEEVSSSGQSRVLQQDNYTGFDRYSNSTDYLLLSTDLGAINYPSQYRVIFGMADVLVYNNPTHGGIISSQRIVDFTNTVHIPPPQFSISILPSSVDITQGKQKTIRMEVQASKSIASLENIGPHINFFSNQTHGVKLNFSPNQTDIPFTGIATSEVTITVPENVTAGDYILPIFANTSFPSEFFANPSENITTNSNLTITIKQPLSWQEQFRTWLSDWFTPLSGIPVTIVSLISGILGWGIGNKLNKRKDKKINDWVKWE